MDNPGYTVLTDLIADNKTQQSLLPPHLRSTDNNERRKYMKRALSAAIEKSLTPTQKYRFELYFCHGKTKTEIAKSERLSCSAVTKALRIAQGRVREYAEIYLSGYEQAALDLKDKEA
ncbi:MAG: hypothetical protein FWH02_06620 [Oscillospiraceae bacterium]|nr:hypothetical protein [Oscillospiraceae bacterium]